MEEYKKKYEDLKYNVETFVNPDILDIKKVEIGTIFNGGNRDDMKKLILLNLDNIVDNLYHEVSMGVHCTGVSCELGLNYDYSMYVVFKPKGKEEEK